MRPGYERVRAAKSRNRLQDEGEPKSAMVEITKRLAVHHHSRAVVHGRNFSLVVVSQAPRALAGSTASSVRRVSSRSPPPQADAVASVRADASPRLASPVVSRPRSPPGRVPSARVRAARGRAPRSVRIASRDRSLGSRSSASPGSRCRSATAPGRAPGRRLRRTMTSVASSTPRSGSSTARASSRRSRRCVACATSSIPAVASRTPPPPWSSSGGGTRRTRRSRRISPRARG